jgi:hypothetical protein
MKVDFPAPGGPDRPIRKELEKQSVFFLPNFSNIKIQIITEMCYQLVVEVEK